MSKSVNTISSGMRLRKAKPADTANIVDLVNICYRGELSRQGWTTEADILGGLRTDAEEISQLIDSENAIILLCEIDNVLVGSICIAHESGEAQLGLFVVKPDMQGKHIGKRLLQHAEDTARHEWEVGTMSMSVITCRHELIAYYERRGYQRTGIIREFPVNPDVWQPKVEHLALEQLEKAL